MFPLLYGVLSPIRDLLVTTNVYVLLLPPSGYPVMLVVVVHRHDSQVVLLVIFLPWKLAWCL